MLPFDRLRERGTSYINLSVFKNEIFFLTKHDVFGINLLPLWHE